MATIFLTLTHRLILLKAICLYWNVSYNCYVCKYRCSKLQRIHFNNQNIMSKTWCF